MDSLDLEKHAGGVGTFDARDLVQRFPKLRFEADGRAPRADPHRARGYFNTLVCVFAIATPAQSAGLQATRRHTIKEMALAVAGATTARNFAPLPQALCPKASMSVIRPKSAQRGIKRHKGGSLAESFGYAAYKRRASPQFHRFEGAKMPEFDLVANLRAALERRRISLKEAAYMCKRHPDSVQRIFQGRTAKLDARDVEAIARSIAEKSGQSEDRARFLQEVFEIATAAPAADTAASTAELDKRILRLERLAAPQSVAIWFDETGSAARREGVDLRALAYDLLGLKPGTEDILSFACRNLGYVGMTHDAVGTLRLHYAPDTATRQSLMAARDWLRQNSPAVRRVWRNDRVGRSSEYNFDDSQDGETASDALSALNRRILAATPLPPKDWLVERRRLDEAPDALRDTLRLAHAGGNSPMNALAAANRLRATHVYAIVDGEAVALQMSAAHNLPTSRYIGRRLLDRPTDRDFAALVDRHLNESLRENSATLYKLALPIGGARRNYWRLAMPDRQSGIVVSAPFEPPESAE